MQIIILKYLLIIHKSGKCEFCEDMKDSIDATILSIETIVEQIKTSSTQKSFISDKDYLTNAVASDPLSYYFAIEEDSFLFIDMLAIPIQKGSHLSIHFNSV